MQLTLQRGDLQRNTSIALQIYLFQNKFQKYKPEFYRIFLWGIFSKRLKSGILHQFFVGTR